MNHQVALQVAPANLLKIPTASSQPPPPVRYSFSLSLIALAGIQDGISLPERYLKIPTVGKKLTTTVSSLVFIFITSWFIRAFVQYHGLDVLWQEPPWRRRGMPRNVVLLPFAGKQAPAITMLRVFVLWGRFGLSLANSLESWQKPYGCPISAHIMQCELLVLKETDSLTKFKNTWHITSTGIQLTTLATNK